MESGAMAQLQALHTLQGMGGIQVHAPPPPPPPHLALQYAALGILAVQA